MFIAALFGTDRVFSALAYDFSGHEHVNLVGAPRRSSFSAALIQVQIPGVDAPASEQVALELFVVTRLSRRPVSALHCLM